MKKKKTIRYLGKEQRGDVTVLKKRITTECAYCRRMRIAVILTIIIGGTVLIGLVPAIMEFLFEDSVSVTTPSPDDSSPN